MIMHDFLFVTIFFWHFSTMIFNTPLKIRVQHALAAMFAECDLITSDSMQF